jgi:hypothetical protein
VDFIRCRSGDKLTITQMIIANTATVIWIA